MNPRILAAVCLVVAGAARADLPTQRVAATTIALPAVPPPATTNGYETTDAFPGLTFSQPIAVAVPPGETNRLFVVLRPGTIMVITNLASPASNVFLNINGNVSTSGEGGLLGLAFHPDYASNRYFYVYYTSATVFQDRVSRFQASLTNAAFADPGTETVLYSQVDEASNHNAGDLHFGPDGYLYVAAGDEGGGNDSWNNAQKIDQDFFSAILRLDVDKKPGSLAPNPHAAINAAVTNYAIPPDNPYISTTNFLGSNLVPERVRTEFFAVGLRNPFRFTFDPINGRLLCADVGQNLWEEVDQITNGGNYGWAFREGFIAGPRSTTNVLSLFTPPLLAYFHGTATNQGTSITGGIVYYGDRLPELYGHYIFSDYNQGHIWSMTDNGVTNTGFRWLTFDANISGFGRDPRNGDVLLCDLVGSQVKRLVRSGPTTNVLPLTLADTGLFQDLQTLTPRPGIVPYEINVPFWSDNAIKSRWFSVPSTNLFLGFSTTDPWAAPTGTVWIKHFELELTNGVPASRRRVETRILVKNQGGDGGYGITYRWGATTTNAALVGAAGLDELFVIQDGSNVRTQLWRYPSRGECLACHKDPAGFALGFNTAQLNLEGTAGGLPTNQLRALVTAGYFSNAITAFHTLPALAHATNGGYSLEYRVRSYLQANCSQCHQPGGSTPANFDARVKTPLSLAGLVNGSLNDTMGNPANRVAVPGVLTNSMLHTRIGFRGPGQMPPLGSAVVDTQNLALVAAWIQQGLAGYQDYEAWQVQHFGVTNALDAQRGADPDGDGWVNEGEYLAGTAPTNALEFWGGAEISGTGGVPVISFERIANRLIEIHETTNLLDGVWTALDVPGNEPVAAATNTLVSVTGPVATNAAGRYFRVEMREP